MKRRGGLSGLPLLFGGLPVDTANRCVNSLLLQNREWLIQPEALQSMATSLRGLSDHEFFPKKATENPLLTNEDGKEFQAAEGVGERLENVTVFAGEGIRRRGFHTLSSRSTKPTAPGQ